MSSPHVEMGQPRDGLVSAQDIARVPGFSRPRNSFRRSARKGADIRTLLALAGARRRRFAESYLESVDGRPLRLWQPDSGVQPSTKPSLQPLAVRPTGVTRREAADMLLLAVRGLPVARADRSLLVRAEATWDAADVVILASLLARARQLGRGPVGEPQGAAGRREPATSTR